jgi:hypothetical protein
MPVSSTAFPWTPTGDHQQQQHSSLTSSSTTRGVESSAGQGGGSHSLNDWTHFDNIPSENSEDRDNRDNILKQLLKDPDNDANDNGPHALLRQILNEKPRKYQSVMISNKDVNVTNILFNCNQVIQISHSIIGFSLHY